MRRRGLAVPTCTDLGRWPAGRRGGAARFCGGRGAFAERAGPAAVAFRCALGWDAPAWGFLGCEAVGWDALPWAFG